MGTLLARKGGSRGRNLEVWHEQLRRYFLQGEARDLIYPIASHPALAGPKTGCFLAGLCHDDEQTDRAKLLLAKCPKKLPGHSGFQEFAKELGVPPPFRA